MGYVPMLILMELALLYGGVLTCHTELLRMYSLTRSRSLHITRYNNRWIILSDGSGEGINANPSSVFGVAYIV